MSLLEKSWEQREEDIYKNLFGDVGPGIYPVSHTLFEEQFGVNDIDPRWLHTGVLKSPPNIKRNSWLYISSGMSNPWETDEKEEYSGLGIELLLETTEDDNWPIQVLHYLIAFNTLLSIGKYGDKPLLDYGNRIPLAIEPNLSHVILTKPEFLPISFSLCSGDVDFLQVVGVTQKELEYAKKHGSSELISYLLSGGSKLLVDSGRQSAV